jgi:hypothetical protein
MQTRRNIDNDNIMIDIHTHNCNLSGPVAAISFLCHHVCDHTYTYSDNQLCWY